MKYPASHLTPFLPTFPEKTVYKRILSSTNSARAPASPLSTFRMNTCKSVSKQRTLSPFRMNTYAKTGGGGSHTFAPVFRIRLPRIPLRASPPQRSFVFKYLQIPRRANPFFSHPYKMPGVWHPPVFLEDPRGVTPPSTPKPSLCSLCPLCSLC